MGAPPSKALVFLGFAFAAFFLFSTHVSAAQTEELITDLHEHGLDHGHGHFGHGHDHHGGHGPGGHPGHGDANGIGFRGDHSGRGDEHSLPRIPGRGDHHKPGHGQGGHPGHGAAGQTRD